MFLATILLCGMIDGQPKCIEAEDTRGPYETHQECVERVEEMSLRVRVITPWLQVRAYKCSKDMGV